jgi:hypothetical protein
MAASPLASIFVGSMALRCFIEITGVLTNVVYYII